MRSGPTRAHQAAQLRKKDGEPERPSMQITRAAYPVIGSLPRRKMHRSKKITRTTGARVTKLKSAKLLFSATRADLRRDRHGRRRDHRARRPDLRQTPASASSATDLRAAASWGRACARGAQLRAF